MNLIQLNCLIEHLVVNKRHKNLYDEQLIKFYKDKQRELIKQININIKTELIKIL